jgi:hypothetical protein
MASSAIHMSKSCERLVSGCEVHLVASGIARDFVARLRTRINTDAAETWISQLD